MDKLFTGSTSRVIVRSIMLTLVLLPCVMAAVMSSVVRGQEDMEINGGVDISSVVPPSLSPSPLTTTTMTSTPTTMPQPTTTTTTSTTTATPQPTTTTTTSTTTTTTTTLPSTTSTAAPACLSFDWNVPSDNIFIIDTSQSFGENRFMESKDFFRELLCTIAVLRPNFSRMAVLTFANETITVMNFLSGGTDQIAECELFSPGGLWDKKLVYTKKHGEKIAEALNVALDLLSQQHEGRKQRVWLATDMENMADAEDIGTLLHAIKEKAEFFGIGLGTYHKEKEMQRFHGYVSSPSACYYHSLGEWDIIKTRFTKPKPKQGRGDWISYVDQDVASCDCSGLCMCQEFTGRFSETQIKCVEDPSGDSSEDDKEEKPPNWTLFGVGAGVGTLFLVALVIAIICCCIHHRKKKSQKRTNTLPKFHENMSTNTEPQCISDQCSTRTETTTISMGTNASYNGSAHLAVPSNPGVNDEHVYANDLVPEIIRAHTADRRPPTGPSPTLPPRDRSNAARSNRPPPVPTPLPDSYAVHGQPLSNPYVEIVDENWHTFPQTARQQSGTYAHVETNHSRQQSRVSQIQTDDNGYLNMQGGTMATQVKRTPDRHSFAASIWQKISSVSSKTPKQINGHSNTVPNPRREKSAPNRKYKQNGAAPNSGSDIQPKRNSAKVGTVRFQTLLSKFSNDVSDADEQVARQPSRLDEL